MNKERQELYCHECQQYVQFDIDISLNGNHIITCPNCGHEHCRVVTNGVITETRWDSRNRNTYGNYQTYTAMAITSSSTSTFTVYSTAGTNDNFMYGAWMNASTDAGGYC